MSQLPKCNGSKIPPPPSSIRKSGAAAQVKDAEAKGKTSKTTAGFRRLAKRAVALGELDVLRSKLENELAEIERLKKETAKVEAHMSYVGDELIETRVKLEYLRRKYEKVFSPTVSSTAQ